MADTSQLARDLARIHARQHGVLIATLVVLGGLAGAVGMAMGWWPAILISGALYSIGIPIALLVYLVIRPLPARRAALLLLSYTGASLIVFEVLLTLAGEDNRLARLSIFSAFALIFVLLGALVGRWRFHPAVERAQARAPSLEPRLETSGSEVPVPRSLPRRTGVVSVLRSVWNSVSGSPLAGRATAALTIVLTPLAGAVFLLPILPLLLWATLSPGLPLLIAILGLYLVLAVYAATPALRLALRLAPPRTDGRPRRWLLTSIGAAWGFAVGSLLSEMWTAWALPGGGAGAAWLSLLTALPFAAPGVLLFAFTRRHLRPGRVLSESHILFLRRFSSFSDLVVADAVLKGAPRDTAVAFLTPTRTGAADWNPFLVGFAGLRWTRPLASIPAFFRSPDESWEDAAQAMIRGAHTIVIDLSEGSAAMDAEVRMISDAGQWPRTIVLDRHTSGPALPADAASTATRLQYRTSWIGAIPRIVAGWVLLTIVWSFLGLFGGTLGRGLVGAQPLGLAATEFRGLTSVFGWLGGFGWQLLGFAAFFALFVRPSVDRDFRRRLRDVLTERSGGDPPLNRTRIAGPDAGRMIWMAALAAGGLTVALRLLLALIAPGP